MERKIQSFISCIMTMVMLISMASPFIVQAGEMKALELSQQQKWLDILEADLSGGESEAADVSFWDDNFEQEEIVSGDTGIGNMEVGDYRTNRFIIKYKDEEAQNTADEILSRHYRVNAKATEAVGVSHGNSSSDGNGNNDGSNGKRLGRLKNTSAIETVMYMTESEFKSEVVASGISESAIEYIQPDYEMTMSSEEAVIWISHIDDEDSDEHENLTNIDELDQEEPNDETADETADEIIEETAEETADETTEEIIDETAEETAGENGNQTSPGNNNVIVALLDSGIDTTHPDLAAHIIGGWDFVNDDDSVNDEEWYYDQWHATHIAGIIADSAPDALILPLKIFQGGSAYTTDIIRAVEYAEMMGATVANCSWGSRYENRALCEAMENSGMLFVCAAGNSLYNIDNYPVYPASFSRELPNVIAVAATDSNDIFSRRSNYGVETVDVAAPGEDIHSAWLEGGYNSTSGTSMSAGFVSGLAALIQSKGMPTAEHTKTRIIESSDTITGLQDKIKGGKRINYEYAVSDNLQPNPTIIYVPDDEEIPEIIPYGEVEEDDYEEFGAENYVDIKANMITARHGLQVVELDGKIYAIGGQTTATSGYSSKVEMYDPITNTWAAKANMAAARSYFGAVAYGGKIYVFGGYNGTSYLNSIEVYTPSTNLWTTLTAVMPLAMSSFSATLNSAAGKVYIMGGTNGTIRNTVYEYTISTNKWATKASLNSARANHAAFIYANNIYLQSGALSNGLSIGNQEIYNISNFTTISKDCALVYSANSACLNTNERCIGIGGRTTVNSAAQYNSQVKHKTIAQMTTYNFWTTHINIGRACHGAVLVNGKVYVIGGINSYGVVNTVEEIDLGWQEKAQLPVPLKNFSTAENNGKLYVLGGEKLVNGVNERAKTVYEYSPMSNTNTWTQKADLPFYVDSARFVSAYGKIYLMGGRMSSTPTGALSYITNIYEYDPAANVWTQKCAPKKQKYNFGSAFHNGKIYSAGGTSSSGALAAVETYDPLTNTASLKNNIPATMAGNKLITINEKLYLQNGAVMYIYNETGDSWTNKNPAGAVNVPLNAVIYNNLYGVTKNNANISPAVYKYSADDNIWTSYATFNFFGAMQAVECVNNRMYIFTGSSDYSDRLVEYIPPITPWVHKKPPNTFVSNAGTAYINGKIYVVGGIEPSIASESGKVLEEYNPATNTWEKKAPMNYIHYHLAAAAALNKIYAIGGYNTTVMANVEEYNPATNKWTNKAALPAAAFDLAAATVNDKIYVFGGIDVYGTVLNTVREYNPATNVWSVKAAMPTARYGAGAVAINGKIYVAGGFKVYDNKNPTDVLEVYDPATNTWTTKAKMPCPVAYGGVGGKDTMYYIGGTDWYNQMTDVLEYNPTLDKWTRWIGPDMATWGSGVAVTDEGIYAIGGRSFDTLYSATQFAPINSIYTASDYVHMGSDEINLTGNFSRTYIDMSVQSPGFTMNFSRTYNSRDERDAGKGNIISKGWTFGFQGKLDKLDTVGNDVVIRLPDGSGCTFRENADGTFTAKDTRSKLAKSGTSYILTTKDQYTYTFSAKGYMTYMKDRNGNAVTITIDSGGKPTQVKDQAGRAYTIAYVSNRISTITEPGTGRVVTYAYDAYNRLASVTDPGGIKTYYTYTTNDANGYLASVKDNTNSTVVESIAYYPLASGETLPMVQKVTNINGNYDLYTYTKSEGKLNIKDQKSRETNTWYDKSMYPVRKTDTEGKETRTIYFTDGGINRYGEPASQTDRNGNTTYYDRDGNGNVTRVINPDGSIREYTYDGKNNLLTEKDEEGRMTYYVYSSAGNLTIKAKPLNGTTVYTTTATQTLFAIEKYAYYTSAEATTMCGKAINGLMKT